jgi:1-phosphatidylinositol phosphodiesterase
MSHLDDDILVSDLTLPGTHDSAAFTRQWPFIATQNMTFDQQLDAGLRYFDLRCGMVHDVPEMVHGTARLGLPLREVFQTMYTWLDAHPTEGLVVQVKEDRKPEASTVDFSNAIFQRISTRSDRWRTANTTPSLAELRGRIQLFRRYHGPSLMAYGINVTNWVDDAEKPFTIDTGLVQLTVQDHYTFSDPLSLPSLITAKGGDVSGLLERADRDPDPSHWYLNFTSAYEFNLFYQLTPRAIAVGGYYGFQWVDGMNARLREYIRLHPGRRRWGIVAMDFPETGAEDLIEALILTNFQPQHQRWKILVLILLALVWLAGVIIVQVPPVEVKHVDILLSAG